VKKTNTFHYDANVITALLPVEIPQQDEARGDLMLFPNLRPFRSSVLFNVIEKTLMQNMLARYLLTKAIKYRLVKPMTLYLKPGNIYFFMAIARSMLMVPAIPLSGGQRRCFISASPITAAR
jgi:hypothetical protein